MAEIELDGVTCTFGDLVAVEDVDLTVRDGELLVVVGPSGCGKTTLLRTIAGLERPAAGDVYIDGRRVTDRPARQRDLGFVFQDYALFPHLSVRENIAFDLRMRRGDGWLRRWLPGPLGRSPADDDPVADLVEETADMLGIGDLLDRSVDELSGGQQQRVALGRAIAADPATFLLDEPLANLDAQLRDRMRTELARLQRDLGTTTVHVTHDQREAMTMGDRVAVFRAGRLQQVGPPAEIYARPANTFVARFVGTPPMNFLPGRVDPGGEAVEVAAVDAAVPVAVDLADRGDRDDDARPVPREGMAGPAAVGDDSSTDPGGDAGQPVANGSAPAGGARVLVGVRPEHVSVERAPDGPSGGVAEVDLVEFHGADGFFYLVLDEGTEVVARADPGIPVGEGDRVDLAIDPAGVHAFDPGTGARLPTEPVPDDTTS